MAIVIAYRGSLAHPHQRDLLLEDLRRSAVSWGWPCQEVVYPVTGIVISQDPSVHQPPLVEEEVCGVQLTGPGAGPFPVTFNRKGELAQYTEIPRQLLSNPAASETYYLESTPWVKTEHPGTHVLILLLLRRMKMRFLRDLDVEDDTGFWRSADYGRLHRMHGVFPNYNGTVPLIAGVAQACAAIGEDPELLLRPLDPAMRRPYAAGSRGRAMVQSNPA